MSKQGCTDPMAVVPIMASIRKHIVSGKGGENALKISPDGTFICPVDTVMDNLKIVETAIDSNGARDKFGIGLCWDAETLYNKDTRKYESQNVKTPYDNDQMIEYLVKLLTDKPIIIYLEDPLAPTELASWKKLKTRISQTQALKHVKIGSRNHKILPINRPFSQQNLKSALNNLSILATSDSHPDLTEQQLAETNANKFSLDFFQVKAFQLATVSTVLKSSTILQKANTRLLLQDNLIETMDTVLVDMCWAIGASVNLSTINGNQPQRICKLNRINQIIKGIEKEEQ